MYCKIRGREDREPIEVWFWTREKAEEWVSYIPVLQTVWKDDEALSIASAIIAHVPRE